MNDLFTPRQDKIYRDSNARINIAWGAVRSGKSFVLEQFRFPEFIQDQPGDKLIIGKTLTSIIRNVLKPMQDMWGVSNISWSKGNKEANILGTKCYIEGANTDVAYQKIQGMTAGAILINELALIPESMFKQCLSRLSVKGAKLFATCNPASPKNYVKTDLLDREHELDLKTWKFVLDDN